MVGNLLQLSSSDIELFCSASHDRNPIHISESYARRTPYGSSLVFGVLSGLAALGSLKPRPNQVLSQIKLQFHDGVFPETPYRLYTSDKEPTQVRLKVQDGKRILLGIKADFISATHNLNALAEYHAEVETQPAILDESQLIPGLKTSGLYSPAQPYFQQLLSRLNLLSTGVSSRQAAIMLCCSYIIGMRIPGLQALFTELSLEFLPHVDETPLGVLSYEAELANFDSRYNLASLNVSFIVGDRLVAKGRLNSTLRKKSVDLDSNKLEKYLDTAPDLSGRVGVVIGGSRGLGRAISYALAKNGCTTYVNYSVSDEEAALLKTQGKNNIHLFKADAAESGVFHELRDLILQTSMRLDFLVLNAAMTPRPMSFGEENMDRILEYISHGLKLACSPMSALLPLIDQSAGHCVIISSEFVEHPVANLSHYISTKSALEGLAKGVSAEYPRSHYLLVRPPRLLTDWATSGPQQSTYLSCESAAAEILSALTESEAPPGVRVMEKFVNT